MWGQALAAILVSGALAAAGCGGGGDNSATLQADEGPKIVDPGPVHVHGLGVNPADGALFIATHTGMFRAPEGKRRARRVAGHYQDTMGFTVVGPDRFLGSGHPDGRENLPPFLGLIESTDAGQTWHPLSLQGKRDFHVLEARGERVYGFGSDFESREQGLLLSDDGGRKWEERTPPEPLLSLAIHPRAIDRAVASGEGGLYDSANAGRTWRRIDDQGALVAWPAPDALYAVHGNGAVSRSEDEGGTWREVGDVDGQPAAFLGRAADELYVAIHDGTVKQSSDGGRTWAIRSAP